MITEQLFNKIEEIKNHDWGMDITIRYEVFDRKIIPVGFNYICDIRNGYTFMSNPNIRGQSFVSMNEAIEDAIKQFEVFIACR